VNDSQYSNKMKRVIKKKLDLEVDENKNIALENKRNFVRLEDDYINMSKYLFDFTIDCDNNLSKLNEQLEVVDHKINNFIEFIEKDKGIINL